MREAMACRGRWRGRLAWLGVALAACQPSYYEAYRAAHPGFEAQLPRPNSDLEELLASLYAPDANGSISVEVLRVEILRVDTSPWQPIAFEAIRSGALHSDDAQSYAVVVDWSCTAEVGLQTTKEKRAASYLLPDNRLQAWDHYRFRAGCAVEDEFVAARRGSAAQLEGELASRVAQSRGKTKLGLEGAYRRGLAYLEVGRLAEAQALARIAEPGFRAAEQRARIAIERGRSDPLAEVRRLRARLLRALGVHEPPV